mmetsp:Transcript_15041/g.32811  ORF Transcript_15041/g.32811 Transcript_15041/m.32811 type:complete len:737 (-) Transcript_15041:136-2346(-)
MTTTMQGFSCPLYRWGSFLFFVTTLSVVRVEGTTIDTFKGPNIRLLQAQPTIAPPGYTATATNGATPPSPHLLADAAATRSKDISLEEHKERCADVDRLKMQAFSNKSSGSSSSFVQAMTSSLSMMLQQFSLLFPPFSNLASALTAVPLRRARHLVQAGHLEEGAASSKDICWEDHKERCADVDYELYLHVGLNSHVQMVATPLQTNAGTSSTMDKFLDPDQIDEAEDKEEGPVYPADSRQVAGCHSVILQDTIMLSAETRGKEAFVVKSQGKVDSMVAEALKLERMEGITYKWHHIAKAFEMARFGKPGMPYDILRNCCASFVVDMMSYSGAPADVNALVNYFIQRWVYQGRGELINRDYLADLIPQAGPLRAVMGNMVSDETLVAMIVKYYVWEYYDPHKAAMEPGTEGQFGSGSDPVEYFLDMLKSGVDRKYNVAKQEVEKQGLDESYLHQDFSTNGITKTFRQAGDTTVSLIVDSFQYVASFFPSKDETARALTLPRSNMRLPMSPRFLVSLDNTLLETGEFLALCGSDLAVAASIAINEAHFCIFAEPSKEATNVPSKCEGVSFCLADTTNAVESASLNEEALSYYPVGTFGFGDLLEAYPGDSVNVPGDGYDIVTNNGVNIVLDMLCALGTTPTPDMIEWAVNELLGSDNTTQTDLVQLMEASPNRDLLGLDDEEIKDPDTSIPVLVDTYLKQYNSCLRNIEDGTSGAPIKADLFLWKCLAFAMAIAMAI